MPLPLRRSPRKHSRKGGKEARNPLPKPRLSATQVGSSTPQGTTDSSSTQRAQTTSPRMPVVQELSADADAASQSNAAVAQQPPYSQNPPYSQLAPYPPQPSFPPPPNHSFTYVYPHLTSTQNPSQVPQQQPVPAWPYPYPPYAAGIPSEALYPAQPPAYNAGAFAATPTVINSVTTASAPADNFGVNLSALSAPPTTSRTPSQVAGAPRVALQPQPNVALTSSDAMPQPSTQTLVEEPVASTVSFSPAPVNDSPNHANSTSPANLDAPLAPPTMEPSTALPEEDFSADSDPGYDDDQDEEHQGNGEQRPKKRRRKEANAEGKRKGKEYGRSKYNEDLELLKEEARAKGFDPNKPTSGKNAWAGWVEGAGMGSGVTQIYRKNFLLPAFKDQAEATKNYRRWLIDIFSRAEVLARRTNCWFYMAVQHPNANTPFHYYASPKLRREAPEAMKSFHTKVSTTMQTLMTAEKGTKVSLADDAVDAREQLEAAKIENQVLKERLERLERLHSNNV
ncbi:hypothetical protein NMY22_g193 [Coprinellus aureogranulatus]|nr:hypothetical protein NMY22_g193 [Coprinellus aureogranulatus]